MSDGNVQSAPTGEITDRTAKSPAKTAKPNRVGLVLAVVSIILTYGAALFFGSTQVSFDSSNGADSVASAMSLYLENDANSTTVYNQMVTNGWVAKDLLETVGNQNATMIDNQLATAKLLQGTNTLIMFGLGMVAVIGIAVVSNLYHRSGKRE